MSRIDAEIYGNPNKLYQVKLLRTNKNGGFFKTMKEALSRQKEYETKEWYATIIRVDPTTQAPLYGQDGWPMPLWKIFIQNIWRDNLKEII